MKIRVGVFFGGKSVEHEVSVISAMQAIAALKRDTYDVVPIYMSKDNFFYTAPHLAEMESYRDIPGALKSAQRVILAKGENCVELVRHPRRGLSNPIVAKIDVALPVVHGTNTEDGTLQGFLEYFDLPYAGPDVASSACGMDKWAMKTLFMARGLPVPKAVLLERAPFFSNPEGQLQKAEALSFPVIVKPRVGGSSVGVSRAENLRELEEACFDAFQYSRDVICEKAVLNLREINCSVLGDYDGARPSCCEEPVVLELLSYQDKYQRGSKGGKGGKSPGSSKGMQSLSRILPANIPDDLTAKIQHLAVEAFHAISASGVSRIDFLLDDQSGEVFVNEINTIPGSLSFYLWEKSGLSYPDLLDELIALALKRQRDQAKLHYSFDSNLLQTAGPINIQK